MASMNKVILAGNLSRDPELRFTGSGAAVCEFGLAINSKYKSGDDWKEDVVFVEITTWSKQAENCAEYLKKGSGALVDGRLKLDTWETDDGSKRSKLTVVANAVQFLDKKSD